MAAACSLAFAASSVLAEDASPSGHDAHPEKTFHFKADEKTSDASVTVGGARIDYQAVVGTLVVHPKGWDDVADKAEREGERDRPDGPPDQGDHPAPPEAAMSYVAYLKKGVKPEGRPVTFLYNGGPGSSTIWLHMGAFGPRRVVTADDSHSPAAPYALVNNEASLLDASDIVFVDAPGTGFGRLAGHDKEKAFWGVDQDAHAFAEFITAFLSKYGRWNSPKFLFGESYGTTRSAVLINLLETEASVDFNGVILLSQILNFDASADAPQYNPGIDLPYQLALPTYTATAWYHHKLPEQAKELKPLLDEVEQFALTDYPLALAAGAALPDDKRKAVAETLHRYTGLPVAYILKADLRINGGEFEKTLQDDSDITTGRLDTRFSGPTLDPLSKEAEYDPQSAAISSAYISAFNDYVRKDLKWTDERVYKPDIDAERSWDFAHTPPGQSSPVPQTANVMPDLANAMKLNPNLKVMLNAGYYDLATPFFEGIYEMRHLQIPAKLQSNIEFAFYESGHMVYAHEAALKALHDNVAGFIKKNVNRPVE
jgi:carboxypeptidase C (cathepsin A)